MGDHTQRPPSWLQNATKNVPWMLLTAQSTSFVLIAHYSRVMPPAGGKRYLTSTAVFLSEMVKLAVSLTMALYDVSKAAPPSMPATSLFFSLTSAVFSGDSWKLVIPASLGVLSSSLQYIALSNTRAATFQVASQLQFFATAVFGLMVFRRSIAPQKWGLLLLLLVGVALVQIPDVNSEQMTLQNENTSSNFPRSLEEWKAAKGLGSNLHKRSATYEALLTIIGAAVASGLGGIYFEKVLKDSSNSTSIWVRNVQLAIYSVFPALFIGVVFRDGETISNDGFFQGYNWTVWTTIVIQALGGIFSTFSISYSQRDPKTLATTVSMLLSIIGSIYLFEFELNTSFFVGAAAVLVATHYYGNPIYTPMGVRPPPIRVDAYEKDSGVDSGSPNSNSPNEFSIKLPSTPFLSDGLSSSRPTSPNPGYHARVSSSRNVSGSSYFEKE